MYKIWLTIPAGKEVLAKKNKAKFDKKEQAWYYEGSALPKDLWDFATTIEEKLESLKRRKHWK